MSVRPTPRGSNPAECVPRVIDGTPPRTDNRAAYDTFVIILTGTEIVAGLSDSLVPWLFIE
jgi:hypothetical protein